eukprot:m.119254 g.119254  ORF g.119254 m.119254 type:complete len:1286 (+) comp37681_c0_seq2:88-3945(+)
MNDADKAKPIVLPSLGHQLELGQFYDACANTFYDGLSAWTAEEVQRTQMTVECPQTDFRLSTSNSERDESAGLNVEGSVSVKLELFKVSGSAKYLNETKTHAYEARVGATCWVKTRERTMPMEQLMNLKYDKVLKNPKLTHFVSKVVEGGQAHLSFSKQCSSTEEETDLKGELAGTIKQLVSLDGSLNVDKKDEMIEKHKSCEVQLTCDYSPQHSIVTFARAIEEAEHFPQCLKGKTHTLEVHLLPVETLDSTELRICRSLDEIDMNDVSALIDDFQQARLDLAYTKDKVVNEKWFPNIGKQVQRVEKELIDADIAFRNMCTKILPQLRGARALDESTLQLKESLRKAINAAQKAVKMTSRFVAAKKKEKLMIDRILAEAGDVINDLAQEEPIAAHSSSLSLSLAEADTSKHPVQKKLRRCKERIASCDDVDVKSDSESDEDESDDEEMAESTEWFSDSKNIAKNIFEHLQLIKETKRLNEEGGLHKSMIYRISRTAKIDKPRKAPVACGDVVVADERGVKCKAVFHGQPTGVKEFEEKEPMPHITVQWRGESQIMPDDNLKCRIKYWKICDDTDRPPNSADEAPHVNEESADVDILVDAESPRVRLPDQLTDGCYYGVSVQIVSGLVGLSPPSPGVVLQTSRAPSIVSEVVDFYKKETRRLQNNGWELDEKHKFLVVGRRKVHSSKDTQTGKEAVVMVDVMPEYDTEIPFPENDKDATVILMTGESGHGKSTHINGFFNWILKISPIDPIRLLLVDDRKHSDVHSVTDKITVYRIRPHSGCRITEPLYLIDSPGFGDTKGIQADKYVARTYRVLFSLITKIDCVALAMKASENRCGPKTKAVLNNILHQFGVNVKNNIIALLTFADAAEPPALQALHEVEVPLHQSVKINNASFVCRGEVTSSKSKDSDDFNQLYWRLYETGNRGMFEAIKQLVPVSAQQSAEVTKERTELNEHLSFLRNCIIASVNRGNTISADLDIMKLSITAPPNAIFETTIQEINKFDLPPGSHTTLCRICTFTCHKECQIAGTGSQKKGCWAMDDDGCCKMCPCRGKWDLHFDEKYYFETTEKKVQRYKEDIIAEWSDNSKSVEAALLQLINEFIREQKSIIAHLRKMHLLHRRLYEIALRHNPKGILDYVDSLIAEAKARGAGSELHALIVARDVIKLSVEVDEGADTAGSSSEMIKGVMETVKSVLETRVKMTSLVRLKTQDEPSHFYQKVYDKLPEKYRRMKEVHKLPQKSPWLFEKILQLGRSKVDFKTNLQWVISVIKVLLRDGIFSMFQAGEG